MQHIIQYQLFDVAYTNAGKSYDLQSKISDIFNNTLMGEMERLFDRLVPEDTVLSLSEVSLDIGSITYGMLDYQLVDRVIAALEHEIKYRLTLGQGTQSEPSAGEEQIKSLNTSYADLLEYFLLSGTMPWWATGDLMLDPLKVMELLLVQDAVVLKQLILRVGQYSYVRQRLVNQFSSRVIRRIITLLEPAEAEFIFDYHASAVKVHNENKLVENAPSGDFEKALWLFILTYLLVDRGGFFNQKMFVKSTLTQMAHYYNRDYGQLLSLLNIALNNNKLLLAGQNGNLALIIDELFLEDADARYPGKEEYFINAGNDAGNPAEQRVELIRHYLAFGSLPWWAEPYTADDIVNLFIDLVKTSPARLRHIIVTTGQNDEVRKRIVSVFNDEAIAAVVKLLEPANAAFIINYVTEAQELHVKKAVVKTDSKDFKKAVWKFVLDFLLLERGSEFNQRMFLQSNIRKLAGHYNIRYSDMLSYFVQSISQQHQGSIQHAPLFKMLAVLLHEDRDAPLSLNELITGADLTDSTMASRKQIEENQRVIVLKDVLLHWLRYGNIPWWAKEYFGWAPVKMFEMLFAESPTDAALLLKFAATSASIQQRILYQLTPQVIINILKLYPNGDEAVKLYQYITEALAALTKIKQPYLAEVEKQVLHIFWNTFSQGGYTTFDSVAFIHAVTQYLSRKYNVQPAATLNALKQRISTTEGAMYTHVLNELSGDTFISDESLLAMGNSSDDVYLLISKYLDEQNITTNNIANAVFEILKYFLTNNKLPTQFKGTNPAYVNAVIKQLLDFLNKDNAAQLKQLLENENRHDLYKLIETEKTGAQIEGGIEQLISAYLDEKRAATADTPGNEALRVLEYFLINAKLPDYLNSVSINLSIRQLLVFLNYHNRSGLSSLLQKGGHSATARMLLHNVFTSPANTAEQNVVATLKAYFEHDVLAYIKQVSQSGTDIATNTSLADLLKPYFTRPESNSSFIIALLKQTAINRYVAINYSDDVVFKLLTYQTTLIGGQENVEWIKQLQQFFNVNFTDTLLRDRFNILLREFNLQILSGTITAKTPDEYIKALFSFISSVNNSLLAEVAKILSDVGSNSILATRLPLLLQTLQTQQRIDKAIEDVKQELNKADEEAVKQITNTINNDDPVTGIDTEEDKPRNSKDTIYINNAGLVILNPFIATYFIRLGMMQEGKFVDTETQHRAVHLLQYLVNGATHTPEHELVLNKILCNVPIAEPIPIEITITENEKQVSEDLLKAVTNRWEKMQNTGIQSFQASFLQRDGALNFKDDAWNLRVEQRGYDVLLQTLPWNIGMIKTPWMDHFLYVEWT
ncbi:hypothetical protein KXQ82_17810 [Mucilaginibacter sp. HMF5004]|uniref:contractile injection system tape measure protein n=1 Tax=Mucilaginibacter rivuli TaxID=2857527 RepID=UPI001C5E6AA4|nr:contractile injection system tape measure protein [Mucilaginibacter rivuli]MBW4891587.1 hypothetical protein [Mucilaginibacter rivuli]